MKKLMNKKGNKQGVILVIVLFILAMAMIFISAALMLTNATRSRVYTNAERDQARLTVTSAAEAFYRGLEMQEIQDEQLKGMADGNAILRMEYNGTTLPGMTDVANNQTILKIYHPKGLADRYVYCDFETTIGSAVENARIVLYEKDPPDPKGLFVNQLDYNGNQNNNFRGIIGTKAPAGTKDNTIVFRGDMRTNQSENINFESDVYFIGKESGARTDIKFESSEVFNGDMYFLDNVYFNWSKSTNPKFNKDVYFVGKGGTTSGAFSSGDDGKGTTGGGESRDYAKSGSVWTFMNRTINVGSNSTNGLGMLDDSKSTLLLYNKTSKVDDNLNPKKAQVEWRLSIADDLKGAGTNYDTYTQKWKTAYDKDLYSSNVKKAINSLSKKEDVGDYPKTSYLASDDVGLPTTEAALKASPNYKGEYTFGNLVSTYGSTAGNCKTVPGGWYNITGSVTNHVKQTTGTPYVLFLDGSSDYVFYFSGSSTMEGVIFVTLNPTKAHPAYFLIGKGASFTVSDDQSKSNRLTTGFLSVNRGSDKDALYSTITNTTLTEMNKKHDGKLIPRLYVYGLGNNHMKWYGGACIEANVALFDSSYPSNSKLETVNFGTGKDANGDPEYFSFYGRIMATQINNTSGNFKMPYCPDPNKDDDEEVTIQSQFTVVDFIYYR